MADETSKHEDESQPSDEEFEAYEQQIASDEGMPTKEKCENRERIDVESRRKARSAAKSAS